MKRTLILVLAVSIAVLILPRSAAAADGGAVYKAKCAMCHGADGKGETTMGKNLKLRDLGSAEVQKQTNEELEKIIAGGKGKMPGYKGKVSEADIDAVVKFIRTLKK